MDKLLALSNPRFSYNPMATYVSFRAPGLLPHQMSSITVSSNPHNNLADGNSNSHFVDEKTEAHSNQASSQSSHGQYTWSLIKASLAKTSH